MSTVVKNICEELTKVSLTYNIKNSAFQLGFEVSYLVQFSLGQKYPYFKTLIYDPSFLLNFRFITTQTNPNISTKIISKIIDRLKTYLQL